MSQQKARSNPPPPYRLTRSEQRVLLAMAVLHDAGQVRFWSNDIREVVDEMGDGRKLSDGTLYAALDRFESSGWVTAAWEPDPSAPRRGRPRVYYSLTETGRRMAEALLGVQRSKELAFMAPAPGWVPRLVRR
jgi:DNA-binding MarR family transcriptional regulator